MTAELTQEVSSRLTDSEYGWLTTVATIDATGVDCRDDEPYWAKFGALADKFGLTEGMASYSTRIKISIDKVRTTPTEG